MRSVVVSLVRTVGRRMVSASAQYQQRLPAAASMMIRNLSNPAKSPVSTISHAWIHFIPLCVRMYCSVLLRTWSDVGVFNRPVARVGLLGLIR